MRLAALKFENKLQNCIRVEVAVFKIFIWGGIKSDRVTFSHCALQKISHFRGLPGKFSKSERP